MPRRACTALSSAPSFRAAQTKTAPTIASGTRTTTSAMIPAARVIRESVARMFKPAGRALAENVVQHCLQADGQNRPICTARLSAGVETSNETMPRAEECGEFGERAPRLLLAARRLLRPLGLRGRLLHVLGKRLRTLLTGHVGLLPDWRAPK